MSRRQCFIDLTEKYTLVVSVLAITAAAGWGLSLKELARKDRFDPWMVFYAVAFAILVLAHAGYLKVQP